MRFWFVVSWRRSWENEGIDVRVYDDKDRAKRVAQTYNAVLVEVFQNEKDFQTYIDIHDYEFKNAKDDPQPANWVDETTMDLARQTWVTSHSPVVRVGKDIGRKTYQELVESDG